MTPIPRKFDGAIGANAIKPSPRKTIGNKEYPFVSFDFSVTISTGETAFFKIVADISLD